MIPELLTVGLGLVLPWLGLLLWHRRRMTELRYMEADKAGWRQVKTGPGSDVRRCPGCKLMVEGWWDRTAHGKVCYVLNRAEVPDLPTGWVAEQVGRERSNAIGIEGDRTA